MKLGYKTLLAGNSRVLDRPTGSFGKKFNRDFNEDCEKTQCKLNPNAIFIIKKI
jgi:hypothetical protein